MREHDYLPTFSETPVISFHGVLTITCSGPHYYAYLYPGTRPTLLARSPTQLPHGVLRRCPLANLRTGVGRPCRIILLLRCLSDVIRLVHGQAVTFATLFIVFYILNTETQSL